jgi:hypothetical protein
MYGNIGSDFGDNDGEDDSDRDVEGDRGEVDDSNIGEESDNVISCIVYSFYEILIAYYTRHAHITSQKIGPEYNAVALT